MERILAEEGEGEEGVGGGIWFFFGGEGWKSEGWCLRGVFSRMYTILGIGRWGF